MYMYMHVHVRVFSKIFKAWWLVWKFYPTNFPITIKFPCLQHPLFFFGKGANPIYIKCPPPNHTLTMYMYTTAVVLSVPSSWGQSAVPGSPSPGSVSSASAWTGLTPSETHAGWHPPEVECTQYTSYMDSILISNYYAHTWLYMHIIHV